MTTSVPMLRRLDALVGEWKFQPETEGPAAITGHMKFEWLEDKFLIQRADAEFTEDAPTKWLENSPFPTKTIIGLDEVNERYTALYTDGRDVSRIYEMSLAEGVWKMWREAPDFHQRFTGTFSEDGNVIQGVWEGSRDGVQWEHDFDVKYVRVTASQG